MSDRNQIILDTETWGRRELVSVICSRYFILEDDPNGDAQWRVYAREGRSVHSTLISLNRHLRPLGLLALLDEGNPPILSISRIPSDPVAIPDWQQGLIWLMMFSFSTLVGLLWIDEYSTSSSFSLLESFRQSILYFSGPMFLALAFADFARKSVASHFDVKIGNLVPIVFPILSPMWPFGFGGIFGNKRPDVVPTPTRFSLGVIELTTPVILFIAGSAFTFLGLLLTPTSPPAEISNPLGFDLNVLSTVLAQFSFGSDAAIKMQWLHPLALSGLGLVLVAWILLLPIPGFPGDRILQALVGPLRILRAENQTTLFVATLGLMVLVFAVSGYWPWLILASLAAWRRFNSDHIPDPLVIDEAAGLTESQRRSLLAIFLGVLVLGMPSAYPVYDMVDWEGDLDLSEWPTELRGEEWLWETISLELKPDGITPVSGWIQVLIEGSVSRWYVESDCFEEMMVCRFDDVTQAKNGIFNFTIEDSVDADLTPMRLRFIVSTTLGVEEHVIVVGYDDETAPYDAAWRRDPESPQTHMCLEVEIADNETGNLSIARNPYWWIDGETELSAGIHDICIRAELGGWQSLDVGHESSIAGYRFGPELHFASDFGESYYWKMPINDSYLEANVSTLFTLQSPLDSILYSSQTASPHCPASSTVPTLSEEVLVNHTLAHDMPIKIGSQNDTNLSLPNSGWLVRCAEGSALAQNLNPGLDIDLSGAMIVDTTRAVQDFTITSRLNYSIPIKVEQTNHRSSGEAFEISIPEIIEANQSVVIELSPVIVETDENGVWSVVWVTAESDGITIHLVARCSIGGC